MSIHYNADKLKYKPIFTEDELLYLEALNKFSGTEYMLSPRNIETFSIEFAHTSAALEGNTYTYVETEILLKTGRTAASEKKLDEALMLKNMHASFGYLVGEVKLSADENKRPFSYLIKTAHTLASRMLLDDADCGVVRKEPVSIGGTSYKPSDIPQQLEDGFELIVSEYEKIENTFEKAVYVHQNLAYLQYFYDHNKRTARNMCAYTLLADNKMPVMFTERSGAEYAEAVLAYYESDVADYSKFVKYFIASYEKVCTRLNPKAIEQAQTWIENITSAKQPVLQVGKKWLMQDLSAAGLNTKQASFVLKAQTKGFQIGSTKNSERLRNNQEKLLNLINDGNLNDKTMREFNSDFDKGR